MNKRVSCRAIIIEDNHLLVLKRQRLRNNDLIMYYSLPGGGIENGETKEECVLREVEEEMSITCKILGYLGVVEDENTIQYFYHLEKLSGTPTLGGEEKLRNCPENYYEVTTLDCSNLDSKPISYIDKINQAIRKDYQKVSNN